MPMMKVARFAYCTAVVIPPIKYTNLLILHNAVGLLVQLLEREREREREREMGRGRGTSYKTNEHQAATDDCKKNSKLRPRHKMYRYSTLIKHLLHLIFYSFLLNFTLSRHNSANSDLRWCGWKLGSKSPS